VSVKKNLAYTAIAIVPNGEGVTVKFVAELDRLTAATVRQAVAVCHRVASSSGRAKPATARAVASARPKRRAIFLA
jgi:hypothetical protein